MGDMRASKDPADLSNTTNVSVCVEPDPRDARIAELEAALAGLVDALPVCDTPGCRKPATWHYDGGPDIACDEHAEHEPEDDPWDQLDYAIRCEAAERALGRRRLELRGVAGDGCEAGNECGRTGCPECQQ